MTTINARWRPHRLAAWVAAGALAVGTVGLTAPANAVPGGDITGTVLSATTNLPVFDAHVEVYEADGSDVTSTHTDASGVFTLSGLEQGAYKFEIYDHDGQYRAEYYNDVRGWSAATPVVVDASPHDLGQIKLDENPKISGKVLDDDGTPIAAGGWVDLIDEYGGYLNGADIGPDGSYSVYAEPGTYRLTSYAYDDEHFTTWYKNAASYLTATPVTVAPGVSVTGIDMTLSKQLKAITAPSVSGAPFVGQTLTADRGVWNQMQYTQFSYQWLRGGTAIAGATDKTYAPSAADLGAALSVKVTAIFDRPWKTASGEATSAATAAVRLPDIVNTAKPTVSGKAKVGAKLTATTGTWDQADSTFGYQWLRDGVAIGGATSASYVLQGADAGRRVSVQVTASKAGYAGGAAASDPTGKVAKGKLKGVKAKVKGTPKVGEKLKATVKKAKNAKVKYQWLRDGKKIKKATKRKYKLTVADVGHKVRVKAKVIKKGYQTKVVKSRSVKITR